MLRNALPGTVLAAALAATPALAAPPTVDNSIDKIDAAVPARFVMGVKFGGGGTLWDGPDNTDIGVDEEGAFDTAIFDGTRAGYVMSAGFFLQGIFYDHLGIEVGFHFVQHTLLDEVDWSYTETSGGQTRSFEAKSEGDMSWTAFHMPILVKAMVNAGNTRVSLGVGPEFSFTSWSRSSFKITEGAVSSSADPADPQSNTFPDNYPSCYDGTDRLPGTRCTFNRVGVKNENSVYLAVVFGIEIDAGDFIIPIDLYWSYNFSQPKDYLERVVVDPNEIPHAGSAESLALRPDSVDLRTRDSMYGGLRIGLAYQF